MFKQASLDQPQNFHVDPRMRKTKSVRRSAMYGSPVLPRSFDSKVFDCTSVYNTLPRVRVPPKVIKRREQKREWAPLKQSKHAQNTVNPIRKICDALAVPPNPLKDPIRLNLGDPTIAGNLLPSEATIKAIEEALHDHKSDGYGPSVGTLPARQAVASHFSTPDMKINADDVILTSGASHALDLAITAIADPGENILVPAPGFPLYKTLCQPNGIETRQYNLKMNEDGLIDLDHLEAQIDNSTRAIIINNPSNPTGVVFPKEHLEAILNVAFKHKVVIIADEIYGDLVYGGAVFHPMASLSPKVPIISVDGIAKRYLVPGWRLGWAIIHNRYGVLDEVKQGMVALSQKIVGPNSLIQGALPKILKDTPQEFFDNIRNVVSRNADIVYESLSRLPGLRPLKPTGAMYAMVGFDSSIYGTETEFMQELITKESVYALPGSAFNIPNWFRLVLTYPEEVTQEACDRIVEHCLRRLTSIKPAPKCSPLDGGSEGTSDDQSD